jgi:hypothetical protein
LPGAIFNQHKNKNRTAFFKGGSVLILGLTAGFSGAGG